MELAGLLHANLSREETEINGPIRRSAMGRRPYLFNELAAEASLLRERYTVHVGHWSLARLQADREHYAQDARGLVQDVRSHLKKKRSVMPQWLAFIRDEQATRPRRD